jgi:hypothetical protein
VTITGPDGDVTATADAVGAWTAEVPLRKGRNEFLLTALDPETNKKSAEQRLIVTVPLPSGPQAPVLSVSSPADGTSVTNGAIPIVGTTSGTTVTASAAYTGPATGAPATPAGESAPAPTPTEITVGEDGAFEGSIQLTPGVWVLTVTATGEANRQTSVTRTVTVAYTGVNVLVEIRGGRVWLRVRVDGDLAKETPPGGAVFEDGTKLTFTADTLVEIRSGVPAYTFVTVNGISYGALGGGPPGAWAIGPTGPPQSV